jgi:hypothetical protein
MSAYRNKPPPPRWRIIYRRPLLARVGRGALLGGFGALVMSALLAVCLVPALGSSGQITLAVFAFMIFVTGGSVVALQWMTSFAGMTECAVSALRPDPDDEDRCRMVGGHEQWLLPLRADELSEGQTIRVSYRDSAPEKDAAGEREILEIKVIDE